MVVQNFLISANPNFSRLTCDRDSLVRLGVLHEKTIHFTVLQVPSSERTVFLRGAMARRPNAAYWESPEEPPSRMTVWGTKAEVEEWERYVKAHEAKIKE